MFVQERGWYQRDMALEFLRKNAAQITNGYQHSVVYFADDDNSYDVRLFTDYLRNIHRAGVWAVGKSDKKFLSKIINFRFSRWCTS